MEHLRDDQSDCSAKRRHPKLESLQQAFLLDQPRLSSVNPHQNLPFLVEDATRLLNTRRSLSKPSSRLVVDVQLKLVLHRILRRKKIEEQTLNKKVKVSDHDEISDPVGKHSNPTRQKSSASSRASMDNSDLSDDKMSNASFLVTRDSRRKPVAERAFGTHTNTRIFQTPSINAVVLPHMVDAGAQNQMDDLKVKLEEAVKSQDFALCVQIEEQMAALSQSESNSTNLDPQEALTMRFAVVTGFWNKLLRPGSCRLEFPARVCSHRH